MAEVRPSMQKVKSEPKKGLQNAGRLDIDLPSPRLPIEDDFGRERVTPAASSVSEGLQAITKTAKDVPKQVLP